MNSITSQSFKGSYQQTQSGIPYYKTNTGTIIGGVIAGMDAITAGSNFYKKSYAKGAMSLGIAVASLLCGIGYDKLRNKKAQEFSKKFANPNSKINITNDKNFRISQNGSTYYKSSMGLKYGVITGTVLCGGVGIAEISNKNLWTNACKWMENNTGSVMSKPAYIGHALLGGVLFGALVGKIADYFSNKDAYKNS